MPTERQALWLARRRPHGVGVTVGVKVEVPVAVTVGVLVAVPVGALVSVAVAVAVFVDVAVLVGAAGHVGPKPIAQLTGEHEGPVLLRVNVTVSAGPALSPEPEAKVQLPVGLHVIGPPLVLFVK